MKRKKRVEMDEWDSVKSWSCGTSRREWSKQIGGSEFVRIRHSTFLLCLCPLPLCPLPLASSASAIAFLSKDDSWFSLFCRLSQIQQLSPPALNLFPFFSLYIYIYFIVFYFIFFTVGFQFSLLKLPFKGSLVRFLDPFHGRTADLV